MRKEDKRTIKAGGNWFKPKLVKDILVFLGSANSY